MLQEIHTSWFCLQEFDFISSGERKCLRAGTDRFGVENLETRTKWRRLEQVWSAVGSTAVFEWRVL